MGVRSDQAASLATLFFSWRLAPSPLSSSSSLGGRLSSRPPRLLFAQIAGDNDSEQVARSGSGVTPSQIAYEALVNDCGVGGDVGGGIAGHSNAGRCMTAGGNFSECSRGGGGEGGEGEAGGGWLQEEEGGKGGGGCVGDQVLSATSDLRGRTSTSCVAPAAAVEDSSIFFDKSVREEAAAGGACFEEQEEATEEDVTTTNLFDYDEPNNMDSWTNYVRVFCESR